MSGWYSSFEGYSRKELRHALKKAAPSIFERVLQFLEADPRTFGSGYTKVMMWRYIRRYDLDESHIHRLEMAALKYLERPMRPEFKRMCQTMAHIGTSTFWGEVEKQLTSENPITQLNAYCLYPYSRGLDAGERQRLELKRLWRELPVKMWRRNRRRYGPFFSGKDVLEIVMNPPMWIDERIIRRESNEANLPIMRHESYELTALDYRQCKSDDMIEALNSILLNGIYDDISTISAWVLIFYIFGETGSNRAIPVIQTFYTERIGYQFESAKKWLTTQGIRRALQRIGTPEALQALVKYQHADPLLDQHMRSFTTGWLANEE